MTKSGGCEWDVKSTGSLTYKSVSERQTNMNAEDKPVPPVTGSLLKSDRYHSGIFTPTLR
jgi:hypothetical protein